MFALWIGAEHDRCMASELVVQKYGGATLADPQKIKQVAARLSQLSKSGKKVIAVVSAMGQSTNELIQLAQQVSSNPNGRELDMLLSTGERVSMSLLSMALHDLNCSAISFTGSQAGILTSDSHLSAYIIDVRAPRVEQALGEGKIVVLAGFQGVSPVSKEITTLGRGGSDITAIAIAAAMKATHCEILKDVDAVFSADPKLVPAARPLRQLSYRQMMEMTFWGAKVLNYRSVELAFRCQLPLYIGPASHQHEGTWIRKEELMYESVEVLGINSHDLVLQIEGAQENLGLVLKQFEETLQENEIAAPQVLNVSRNGGKSQVLVTGSTEILDLIQRELKTSSQFQLSNKELSAVSVTCTGSFGTEMPKRIATTLAQKKIEIHSMLLSPMSVIVLVERRQKDSAIQALHALTQ